LGSNENGRVINEPKMMWHIEQQLQQAPHPVKYFWQCVASSAFSILFSLAAADGGHSGPIFRHLATPQTLLIN